MGEAKVETGVDELIHYLRTQKKVALKDVSSHLKIPEQTLQLWIDFLVEERIIGLEYKFTKAYIFLNEDEKVNSLFKDKNQAVINIDTFKEEFFSNAKKKQMPEDKIPLLWESHLMSAIDQQKEFFSHEAKKRSIETSEKLFVAYKKRVLEM